MGSNIDGVDHLLRTGDTTWIPANVPHHFLNASQSASMRIFWTYALIAAIRTMAATGETRMIDAEHGRKP